MRKKHELSHLLPQSQADLAANPPPEVIHSKFGSMMYRLKPGILLKSTPSDLTNHLDALLFARANLPGVPIPEVLSHPPIHRRHHASTRVKFCPEIRPLGGGVWYICMTECPGVSLKEVVDDMTPNELDQIASQLSQILHQMGQIKSNRIGSVSRGPHRNFYFPNWDYPTHAFESTGELLDWYRALLLTNGGEPWVNKFMDLFPRSASITFTHGDLIPQNIMVDGTRITGIVDWHTGGFYPSYWEYARMHSSGFLTPGWDYILHKVFPGERRMDEIVAVDKMIDTIEYTFL